jgi:hypothetical protein
MPTPTRTMTAAELQRLADRLISRGNTRTCLHGLDRFCVGTRSAFLRRDLCGYCDFKGAKGFVFHVCKMRPICPVDINGTYGLIFLLNRMFLYHLQSGFVFSPDNLIRMAACASQDFA